MSYQYQVVVIGSGSAGKEACLSAAKAGLRTLLVEERNLGGTTFTEALRSPGFTACASYLDGRRKVRGWHLLDLIETSWTIG